MKTDRITAEDALREGDLEGALAELRERVRANPASADARVFLFQLFCVLGEWDRAMNQLDVLAEMDAATLPMVHTYREALRCEVLRNQVFAGNRSPLVLGDPEPWLALLLESLRVEAAGRAARALELREEAFETAPATPGSIDGDEFQWIGDADMRLGPVLEAIAGGKYYWVPFHRIRSIRIESPEDLRDLVWTPAQFRWANGAETVGFVPTRYVGSESSSDDRLRLARRTEWREDEAGTHRGLGQRMFATDRREHALMDVREIDLGGPSRPEAGGGHA